MNMYIGNLSYNVRESDLRDVMEEFGTVDSVKLIIDRDTRRSKGFAFVEMPEDSEAQKRNQRFERSHLRRPSDGCKRSTSKKLNSQNYKS